LGSGGLSFARLFEGLAFGSAAFLTVHVGVFPFEMKMARGKVDTFSASLVEK
jgi:hypothetical protein